MKKRKKKVGQRKRKRLLKLSGDLLFQGEAQAGSREGGDKRGRTPKDREGRKRGDEGGSGTTCNALTFEGRLCKGKNADG